MISVHMIVAQFTQTYLCLRTTPENAGKTCPFNHTGMEVFTQNCSYSFSAIQVKYQVNKTKEVHCQKILLICLICFSLSISKHFNYELSLSFFFF